MGFPIGGPALTLADVKAHLNLSDAELAQHATELEHFLGAAIQTVTRKLGVFDAAAYTDPVTVRGSVLLLPRQPVIAVTAVAGAYGLTTSYTDADWTATETGIVRLTSGAWWTPGEYTVTYTAGYDPLPEDLRLAVLLYVQADWTASQQGRRGPASGADDTETFGPGYYRQMAETKITDIRGPVVA